jgi:cytochrome c oxidase subunit 1/cytochrome c oxidase subunit I+III
MIWTIVHTAVGLIMLGYCIAGATFGKITPEHDADLCNVTLYWHFITITVVVASLVIGLLPRLL